MLVLSCLIEQKWILNYTCPRLYLTCRGQGRSTDHGTPHRTELVTKHCFGNSWTPALCKALPCCWKNITTWFPSPPPSPPSCIFLHSHAQVNAELNTRLNFHSGWKQCSANAINESEAMSQINGNEMFHFSTSPISDSLPGRVSAEETCFCQW